MHGPNSSVLASPPCVLQWAGGLKQRQQARHTVNTHSSNSHAHLVGLEQLFKVAVKGRVGVSGGCNAGGGLVLDVRDL